MQLGTFSRCCVRPDRRRAKTGRAQRPVSEIHELLLLRCCLEALAAACVSQAGDIAYNQRVILAFQ